MKSAIFTIGKDERFHLPQWIGYYSEQFNPSDMYVLDHESQDEHVQQTLSQFKGNIRRVSNDVVFDHDWLLSVVHNMQRELLERYDYVVYTDTDELIIPARGTLREFLEDACQPAYRCTGYEVIEDKMCRNLMYDKTLVSSHPLTWVYGYHTATPGYAQTDELFLYHLHRLDFEESWAKNQRWQRHQWDQTAITHGFSVQNQIADREAYRQWFYNTGVSTVEPLHPRIAAVLDKLRQCG